MLAEGANYDWAALYYRDILHVPGGQASVGYAAFVAAMTLGRWFGDPLRTRLGDETTVRAGASLTALGLALALLVAHPVTATLGFALSGLGLSNVVPVMYGAAGHALAGRGIAQVATIGYGGFLLGPPVIGFVAEHLGLRAALGIALAGAALVALPRQRVTLGWVAAAFFVAVFPGNVSQYLTRTDAFGLNSDRDRLLRLFFQPVLVAGALWTTGAWAARKRR